MTHIILVAIGSALGSGFIVWLLMKGKVKLADTKGRNVGEVERATLVEQLKASSDELGAMNKRLENLEATLQTKQARLDELGTERAQLSERADRLKVVEQKQQELLLERADLVGSIAKLKADLTNEQMQSKEKLALLTGVRQDMSDQFKVTATEILDRNSQKFTEQNKTNLNTLLEPLGVKITAFKAKIEEVYINEGRERSALGEHVKLLTELNQTLSQDAQNLTLAIRGDRKTQGNWGEIMLDDVLERAGLVEGTHYHRQDAKKTEDGKTQILDVVVHLPGDRHIVIDSKMTLPDYRAFANADDDVERDAALRRHLLSIKAHMKGLSEKNYQALFGVSSLDFVVMFVPLEPAFMLAVTNDRELFQHGWDKNVLLVSPSTLLFVIRTVASLWRQEEQSRNAQDISKRGGELYDRLVGFVETLAIVGKRLEQAQDSYADAVGKLRTNKGNVIRQAEMLKGLGLTPKNALPSDWVDAANQDTLETPVIESDLAKPDHNPKD